MSEKRIVITGMGAVTPIGIGREAFWDSLISGKSGIGPITAFDASKYPSRIAGEVRNFDPLQFLSKKEVRKNDRFVQFSIAAAKLAVEDAKLTIDDTNRYDVGVLIGSGIGGINTIEEQHKVLLQNGPDRMSPFFIPMLITNMASGVVSIVMGAKGPNTCVVTACATGCHAVGDAALMIKRGDAKIMLAGGTEAAVAPLAIGGFSAMKALSTRNDEPQKASRPFDKLRDGFVLAEGAGILVLEELEHALERKAVIYAEVAGYGMTADAYHITAPDPDGRGATDAMRKALSSAKLNPEDIAYINAHGTSTEINDKVETKAIKNVFKDHAYKLAVSSIKSMTGHVLGATGALELIATALTIKHNIIPPTINYEYPDPECDLDYVPNKAREQKVNVAMSNSFGFGGHNAVVVLKKFKEDE
ncbi:MAG: beta-ketoacyl-ACP synthase II [Firmicutes bacterium]|nr:beta-ketoacyl-ACP synthase II [Bacillota bacterium]